MSEEIKKTVLNTLAEPIANSAKNITDKPTQNIGTTFADIWYLVFGGISQAAEKRKLKYSYALQEFEKELKEKISKIPEDKLVEPNIQIIAKALENAKYCVEEEELRHMFSTLISSAMTMDLFVSPIMIDIVSSLSPINAKILNYLYVNRFSQLKFKEIKKYLGASYDGTIFYSSLIELEYLNLICTPSKTFGKTRAAYKNIQGSSTPIESVNLSPLGIKFCEICIK